MLLWIFMKKNLLIHRPPLMENPDYVPNRMFVKGGGEYDGGVS